MADADLKNIPLNKIRESKVALRSVNRQTEEYMGLVDSIRKNGVLCPIVVRELKDPETNETVYGLIDGLQRYTASMDAGKETVPANIKNMQDAEVLEAQILANVHRIETKPVDYSKQLVRIVGQNPLMSLPDLAARLSKSVPWLNDRLSLVKLDDKIQALVNDGKICLSNAYALSKLPIEEQANFLEQAISQTPTQFLPTTNARVKELREAKRQGRDPNKVDEFVAVPHIRKIGDIKGEIDTPNIGGELLKNLGVKDPKTAFSLALQWVLNLDPVSLEARKAEFEAFKAKQASEREARKAERQKKKDEEAAKVAAEVVVG